MVYKTIYKQENVNLKIILRNVIKMSRKTWFSYLTILDPANMVLLKSNHFHFLLLSYFSRPVEDHFALGLISKNVLKELDGVNLNATAADHAI